VLEDAGEQAVGLDLDGFALQVAPDDLDRVSEDF